MLKFRILAFAAVAAMLCTATGRTAAAQIEINVGAAPDCPYGYYDSAPYGCAPYGYYGSEWFTGGVFVGAGPWFHGGNEFRGHVNNRMHPEHGYRGPVPQRGERAEPSRPVTRVSNFRGNEVRDGRGHVNPRKR